jgi:D-glycero-D-manno-heptose 1,7-bisphosphate phosphatase
MKKRAVFLDRDGTINEDVGYPSHFSQVHIYPSSYEAVKKINRAGLLAVVITNQSGIGRGLLSEDDLESIHQKMRDSFNAHNARIDGFYYCPHYISSAISRYDVDCSCRKPHPGMGLRAASALGINLAESYMIGDKVEDVQFGLNIQAKPILVLTGYGIKSLATLQKQRISPAHVAQNLLQAVDWILEYEKPPGSVR